MCLEGAISRRPKGAEFIILGGAKKHPTEANLRSLVLEFFEKQGPKKGPTVDNYRSLWDQKNTQLPYSLGQNRGRLP